MILPSDTTLSLLIHADSLSWALVRSTRRTARCRASATIEGFFAIPEAAQAHALRDVPRADHLTLTVPAGWCVSRRLPIPLEQWGRSSVQAEQSVECLLPFTADGVVIGSIAGDRPDESFLIGVERESLERHEAAIERALGRSVDLILAPQMALMGIAALRHPRTLVLDGDDRGSWHTTDLRHGLVRDIDHLPGEVDSSSDVRYYVREGSGRPLESPAGAECPMLTHMQMAMGAASAPRAAPRHLAPLRGAAPRHIPRWVAPAAMLVISLAFLWAGAAVRSTRFDRAIDDLDHAELRDQPLLDAAALDRRRVARIRDALDEPALVRALGARSILPVLDAAGAALPPDAFLYEMRIDADGITLRGEAPRVTSVLESLGEIPGALQVRTVDPPTPVEERSAEQFHIQVQWNDQPATETRS